MTDKTADKPIAFLDLPAQQKRLGPALRARVDAVLDHCRFVMGPEVAELEQRLADWCGAKECVGVSSGTDALQIVMMAEGIGRGDAVFLPAFTYTATAEVPLVLGATPVFVDVDPNTFQIDPAHLRARIRAVKAAGKLTARAIVGVDLFGQPAPWPELRKIAEEEGLFLLADCAQSFGAVLDGKPLGREATATTLSFFPSKPLGGYGDGGAILTDDPERAALYRSLRTHGEGGTRYEVLRTGMNGRLDTLQAAVLLAKLDGFKEELARRDAIAQAYDAGFADGVQVPVRVPGSTSAWAIYAILLKDPADRAPLQARLKERGVPSAIYYPLPLHKQPAYQDHHDGTALPVSEDLAQRILALPIHPELTDDEVARVIAAVRG
ncbi:DegT/DnrJ/EryC1/StrS family aminotransferase [Acetobacter orleanensis]|uniref:Aminotransferase DegT n=1 Tax=Acetobacter orleanensis TaxID=104099 RepID=A0A4Y3TKF8_9PROT|nr:DegT/DnrJ/EryC1/StrS family aminotransferase [Acetobacter orleanensis]KXV62984.1 aminotransferase DegT [Acetobacter orleanensis]PCD79308.1 DegT/DnrJ/EryC1/StrS family aminotransferase [Acetobacter orleanensis]GAN69711.1 aminotransferase/pleiotropic regulatory protein DegT/DnrJ/EryC37/StrS [Acetobacter orleanensis JCM 7639]GBR23165.1 pleiotropic regulatory protein [Acetobacter orleanensis NRIC 0473]GEB82412.1 aminotransferase DegT [Acetobacter orleanensis]